MKKTISLILATAMILMVFAGCGGKTDDADSGNKSMKIGIVCSSAGRNDNGYNQSAIEGAEKAKQELGIDYKVIDSGEVSSALETLAADNYDIVFNLEYDFEALIKGVGGDQPIAKQYPNTTFVVFNDNPNLNDNNEVIHKNVISVLFDVHEGSFLAGALSVLVNENASVLFGDGYKFAAPTTSRGIGFIGGTNSNGITVFSYGFIEGINHVAKSLGVNYDYYSKYDAGFADPALGSSVAGTYYDNGANIIYGVAGSVGDGITAKAKEVGRLAIQVDANKDSQQPGSVLTSVMKNTNVPVLTLSKALKEGTLKTLDNLQTYSLASGATGITDLSVIKGYLAKTDAASAKWAEIMLELDTIKDQIGTQITVTNSSVGEKFDASKCTNVKIK